MRIVTQLVQEETFTFTPEDGSEEIHILSGQLRLWLLAHAMDKVIRLDFPPDDTTETLIHRHGLEAPRMASMTLEEALEPVIVGAYPGGTHILIDGAHRRWFWANKGQHKLRGWMVPYEVWKEFTFNPAEAYCAAHHRDGSMLPQRRGR